jgi:hypothetical protein
MGAYTDPKLLDVRSALAVLPSLPLDGAGPHTSARTGAENTPRQFAPLFAPTECKPVQTGPILDKGAGTGMTNAIDGLIAATSTAVKENNPLSTGDSGLFLSGRLAMDIS